MGKGVAFDEANGVLEPAPGDEASVYALPMWTDGGQVISCWELSADEIADIILTKRVWFRCTGQTHPPMLITGKHPFQ